MHPRFAPCTLFLCVGLLSACGSEVQHDVADVHERSLEESEASDAQVQESPERDTWTPGPEAEGEELLDSDTGGERESDTHQEKPNVPVLRAYAQAPSASLLPESIESCPIIAESRCQGGKVHQCSLFDANTGEWAKDVPAMSEQAFWFDRYYDLYHQANGLSMDIEFTDHMLAGTPESDWSKPESFKRYDGRGDSSGWTGTALWGAAARYAITGTDADYARMLERTESMAFLYEVTSIPGMMARSHYGMLEPGAPDPIGHWNKSLFHYHAGDGSDGHFALPIDDSLHERLPDYYTEGVDIEGSVYATTPTVQYDTSRDQYVRGLPGLMLAYDLLGEGPREEAIRTTLKSELPCTLNRMKKGRIYNLQAASDILDAVTSYFGGANIILDPDDMDIGALDELVFYVLEQVHPNHIEAYDASCPEGPPMEVDPTLDFDAADPLFLLDFAQLAMREQKGEPVPISFSMHISVRAGDVLFMTQWALIAHQLTGDALYLDFIAQMMEETDYWGTLNLYGAFILPRWCMSHYAPSLTYPTLYNLLARIDPTSFPDFWSALSKVAYEEARLKDLGPRDDAFFGILYKEMNDSSIDPDADTFINDSVNILKSYGMNPDNKLEPDRSYPRNFVDTPDPDITLEEIAPGDPEWTLCEEPSSLMGIEVPAPKIDGIPIRSVEPLPMEKRIGGTFIWQMDPWMVKREYGGIGMETQWPMLGMFTPYWVGRLNGAIQEGDALVLGWREQEVSCTP